MALLNFSVPPVEYCDRFLSDPSLLISHVRLPSSRYITKSLQLKERR